MQKGLLNINWNWHYFHVASDRSKLSYKQNFRHASSLSILDEKLPGDLSQVNFVFKMLYKKNNKQPHKIKRRKKNKISSCNNIH